MRRSLRRTAAGFTLVELMVTLAIAAVLMMVAVPSFQSYARNAAVTRVSGNFFNATQLARANAMRMSRHTLLQVVDADLGWVGGWRVYADMDRDMTYTAETDVLIVEEGPWVEQESVRPFSLEQMDRQYRAGGVTVALGLPSIAYMIGVPRYVPL